MRLSLTRINNLYKQLEEHPLLNDSVITDITGIQIFMENHVFAVWDFMSLIKSLQHYICPSTTCWVPTQTIRSGSARLINEIILGEETDIDIDGVSSISHHDLYCQAMLEIGANARGIESWVNNVSTQGFYGALDHCGVPTPAYKFMKTTFDFIDTEEPHVIAGAFCFGRETIIPKMFTRLAEQLNLTKQECPKFHYYLERHIQLDGEQHGPASIEMVEDLCNHDPVKIHEAEQAALRAIRARITFWDDVADIISNRTHEYYQ